VINVFQNEPVLWNSDLNASEEDKELAWRRLCMYLDLRLLVSTGRCELILRSPKCEPMHLSGLWIKGRNRKKLTFMFDMK